MSQTTRNTLALTLGTLLGLCVRSGRLDWQPLWWDEGYSAYFATEPLARMVWLTAHDIHPPLYYALLHGWLVGFQSAQPLIFRLLSIFLGVLSLPLLAWLTHLFFPDQPQRWSIALLLLLFNPLHLFYSQEVRMYALAMTLGLASTVCLWLLVTQADPRVRRLAWVGYITASVLALYTLYYLAFLLLAHLLWLLWTWRRAPRSLLTYGLAYSVITLLYLPWLLYAGRNLLNYVITDKIPSDADQPLGPLTYLLRHLLAFTTGHIEPQVSLLTYSSWAGVLAVGLLVVGGIGNGRLRLSPPNPIRGQQPRYSPPATRHSPPPTRHSLPATHHSPLTLLWACLLIPTVIGLFLNRNLPFFPQGGERLLLFVLPYFLLLVAAGIDQSWRWWGAGRIALAGMMVSAATGLWLFYTTPRYPADDYRPVIRQIMQQGRTGDTLLAIFPWQVGYWRVYSSALACSLDKSQCSRLTGLDPWQGPTVELAGERALTWGPTLQTQVDQALDRGALWLVTPMNLGSTLPSALESYLTQQQVTPLEQRWVSSSTRLSGWRRLPLPPFSTLAVDFGPVRLTGAGVSPTQVASANQPINLALQWQVQEQPDHLGVTLRLQDMTGRLWTSRDYAPVGASTVISSGQQWLEQAGLIIPVGLPPATYQVLVGVTLSGTEELLPVQNAGPDAKPLLAIGLITVTQPTEPLAAFQLPIQRVAQRPGANQPIDLLGYAGNLAGATRLVGEAVDLTLFLQTRQTTGTDQQLYVSLLDAQGVGVAGWKGWSPAEWRSSQWPLGALVQAPVNFFTPATLPTGEYQLIAGLLDPTTGVKNPASLLDEVQIRRREATFTPPTLPQPLTPPVRFGTHVDLLGYALDRQSDHLALILYWQVQQTLLPPHHLFVHLDDATGATVAQDDGAPVTPDGPAPTGTWQPGEYLTTRHTVMLSGGLSMADQEKLRLRVGLYVPASGNRLPATQDGAVVGDAVEIQ